MVSAVNANASTQTQNYVTDVANDVRQLAQATQSSNYNPLGNSNPLSLQDEQLLRFGPNDFQAQSSATLDSIIDDYDRIAVTSERNSESARAAVYSLAERAVGLGQSALKLPKQFLSANPLLRQAAGRAFDWVENQTLGRLERDLNERVLTNTLDPARAFQGVEDLAQKFEDSSLAIDELRVHAERILQQRGPLSAEDRATLDEIRGQFDGFYGSDLNSGTASVQREIVRTAYYQQHWRVTNYYGAQEKSALANFEAFSRDYSENMAQFKATEDLSFYNEASYALSGMQGAAESARVHRERYVETVNESNSARAAYESADSAYWSVMSNVQNTWARINARLN